MKKTLIAMALAAPLLASAANLLSNGSFETGLTDWVTATSGGVLFPPAVISYGSGVAFGETVSADNAASLSPDLAAAKAVYFVDDNNMQSLTHTFTVSSAGNYNVGFSIYAPNNGFVHPGGASYSLLVDNIAVLSSSVGAAPLSASQTWVPLTGVVNLAAANHTFAITFTTTGGLSKDIVIDRAYVTSAVPEPTTYGMLAMGLAVMGGMVRLRRRR